jgi:hypothetical protein
MFQKARLFVVNSNTRAFAEKTFIFSIYLPSYKGQKNGKATTRKEWNKTFSDILSDMLQTTPGDYAFLWQTSSKKDGCSNSIFGVYRIVSDPFYDPSDPEYPFKVKVEKAFDFRKPVEEYDILNDAYMKRDVWTIIGKKIAQKSRGSTPITPNETSFLIRKLIEINGKNYRFKTFSKKQEIPQNTFPLSLNLKDVSIPYTGTNGKLNPSTLGLLAKGKNPNFRYEKPLEGYFNILFRETNKEILSSIGIDWDKVIWYANYLPYSFEKSEIDYLIMESEDGVNVTQYDVIEFTKDTLDIDHIQRTLLYSKWIRDNLGMGIDKIIRPIAICHKGYKRTIGEKDVKVEEENLKAPELEVYSYQIVNEQLSFVKIR